MNLENSRNVFVATTLVLVLIVASPTFGFFRVLPKREPFSEIWLLGLDHTAENYPFSVQINETYEVFLGIGNHLGHSGYYLVYVKISNQTEMLPYNRASSTLPPLYEFRAFVENEGVWETVMNFAIAEVSYSNNVSVVGKISINNATISLNGSSIWDPKGGGFCFQLFFELWRLDTLSKRFMYDDRFVGIRLRL